ncbi:hypothetical protein H5410_045048 [Solanum commersonii]|uniref:Endonuclease/exonuclease/phosphatase domain-containing protein n=1 Tax=Solanum commersonii TaxID=4109 RepID=A0A9J5XBI3_SOLCO|nr:hypothetical protein H5410_045048 [Solanum commersonii]
MEPFEDRHEIEEFRTRLGMQQAVANANGKIWAFIDEVLEYEIIRDDDQMLTVIVKNQWMGSEVMISLVYVKCIQRERLQLWESMYDLANTTNLSWVIGGDFNVISNEEKKLGGRPVTEAEIRDFNHWINVCNLEDKGFKGNKYTWWNGRTEEDCIFKRLDRVLCNEQLQNVFPAMEIEHLVRNRSDPDPSIYNRERLHKVQADFKKQLHREKEFWKQKARMEWFKEGERNTKFFHTIIKGRRSIMRINRVQTEQREWLEEQEAIAEAAVDFYIRQFTKQTYSEDFEMLNELHVVINDDKNEELQR